MTSPSQYDESSFQVLKGLEPIKQRPGMYTRTDSPLHIVQEVLDNAVDEALGGYATEIFVEVLPLNTIRITDNGRGIPVGMHPEELIPVVQAAFTLLHAGGKFNKGSSDGAYAFSGGLHGVGVTATNALSEYLEVIVCRDGWTHKIAFNEGEVTFPLTRLGPADTTGTSVLVRPNPKYFDSGEVPVKELRDLVRSKAVLLSGLSVKFQNASVDADAPIEVFSYESGLASYLEELATAPVTPIISATVYLEADDDASSKGEGASWALAFYESSVSSVSFVNLIHTPSGGTHVSGLRSALFTAVKSYIEHHGLTPKGIKLTADDVFKTVGFVLSSRMLDPSFEGQTKERLISRDAVKLHEKVCLPYFEGWLSLNPGPAKLIAELVLQNAATRQRQVGKVEKRRNSSVVVLPGKLASCETTQASEAELFLVEGDSAGGSTKMGRNKYCQAILPLRGKGLNVWSLDIAKSMANTEIADISAAIGIPLHTLKDTLDFSKLRYEKICILSDADVDGYHIQVLLLTFFLKHMPQLIERGYIYISKPPLHRVDVEPVGKKKLEKKLYAMDESELTQILEKIKKEGYTKWKVSRFKGLGEMNPPELWETTLNPDTRRLYQVSLPDARRAIVDETFNNLMHKDNANWRREWLKRRGHEITG